MPVRVDGICVKYVQYALNLQNKSSIMYTKILYVVINLNCNVR